MDGAASGCQAWGRFPAGEAADSKRIATMRAMDNPPFFLSLTFALALSCVASGQAQKKPDGPMSKPQSPAPLRDLFLELDANGDRVIERDEVPESGRKAFDTLLKYGDTDNDGKLEAAEYRNLMQKINWARVGTPEQRKRRFKNLDKNEDGKLGPDEFQGGIARFHELDRNGDGFLSRDEIPWLSPGAAAGKAAAKKTEK